MADSTYRKMLCETELRNDTIDVLAEFFQDSFSEDPAGVGDWLAQNGTSVDLFVNLVKALREEHTDLSRSERATGE